MTLQSRVFATNAAVLVLATLVLVLTPLTVSFPIALAELVAVVFGLVAMLALNLVLLRRAFGPLARLTVVMSDVDPLRPGERAAIDAADPEVAELTAAFNDMLGRLEVERRDSARRALAAQEQERVRIARELHDEVGQALTAVVLQLDRAGRGTGAGMRDEVVQARESVRSSLEEVRGIARRLRPEALDDLGLPSALAALTNDVTRRTRLPVSRSIAAGLPALAPDEELVIYRVAQEALTNVVRHAAVDRAELALGVRNGRVELVVRDDGSGFEPRSATQGAGLLGMRESHGAPRAAHGPRRSARPPRRGRGRRRRGGDRARRARRHRPRRARRRDAEVHRPAGGGRVGAPPPGAQAPDAVDARLRAVPVRGAEGGRVRIRAQVGLGSRPGRRVPRCDARGDIPVPRGSQSADPARARRRR